MNSFKRQKKRKLLNKNKNYKTKKSMKREKKTRRQKMSITKNRTRSRVYRNTRKKIKGGTSNVGHYVGNPNNMPYLGYGEYS